eukprot:4481205-Heterocapsa_arctica.AAC.1
MGLLESRGAYAADPLNLKSKPRGENTFGSRSNSPWWPPSVIPGVDARFSGGCRVHQGRRSNSGESCYAAYMVRGEVCSNVGAEPHTMRRGQRLGPLTGSPSTPSRRDVARDPIPDLFRKTGRHRDVARCLS